MKFFCSSNLESKGEQNVNIVAKRLILKFRSSESEHYAQPSKPRRLLEALFIELNLDEKTVFKLVLKCLKMF